MHDGHSRNIYEKLDSLTELSVLPNEQSRCEGEDGKPFSKQRAPSFVADENSVSSQTVLLSDNLEDDENDSLHWNSLSTPPLPEVFASVNVADLGAQWYRKLFSFTGVGLIVSIGYIDPGNWATSIAAGSKSGYTLIFIVLLASIIGIYIQYLSLKLGVVTGRDLPQVCRDTFPKWLNYLIWFAMEVAIAATDLAEVLGSAIAFELLFGLPLQFGVLVTAFDVLAVLFLGQGHLRVIETLMGFLFVAIFACFFYELSISKPQWMLVAFDLLPSASIFTNSDNFVLAIGILGATVMPHNCILGSALIQTRNYPRTRPGKEMAIRYGGIDNCLSLGFAFLINSAILILSASAFHQDHSDVETIKSAYKLLSPVLGTKTASIAFGVALLFSGQQSTLTGTLAGQLIMEGFISLRIRPWLRRLLTRLVAIVPALIIVLFWRSDSAANDLLLVSQLILSLTLSFAIVPLAYFTTSSSIMGSFVASPIESFLTWFLVLCIIFANVYVLFLPVTFCFGS